MLCAKISVSQKAWSVKVWNQCSAGGQTGQNNCHPLSKLIHGAGNLNKKIMYKSFDHIQLSTLHSSRIPFVHLPTVFAAL
jgi:hypothetical protein